MPVYRIGTILKAEWMSFSLHLFKSVLMKKTFAIDFAFSVLMILAFYFFFIMISQ